MIPEQRYPETRPIPLSNAGGGKTNAQKTRYIKTQDPNGVRNVLLLTGTCRQKFLSFSVAFSVE